MTSDELRERIRIACAAFGSQRQFALAHGMSPGYLGEVLNGTREPGPLMMRVMRVRRRVVYESVPADPLEFE